MSRETEKPVPIEVGIFVFALCAVAMLSLGTYDLVTTSSIPPEARAYEDTLASIAAAQKQLDSAKWWVPSNSWKARDYRKDHPEIAALEHEIDRLKRSLPEEPPEGYGAVLVKYGSADVRRTHRRDAFFFVALGGVCAVLSVLLALARAQTKGSDSLIERVSKREWARRWLDRTEPGMRARMHAAKKLDEATVEEMEEEAEQLFGKRK